MRALLRLGGGLAAAALIASIAAPLAAAPDKLRKALLRRHVSASSQGRLPWAINSLTAS